MEEKDLREQDEEHSQKKTSADSSELVPSVDDPSADYDSGEKKNEPVAEKKQEAKPPKKKSHIREWVEALVFAFAGVLILKTFVFEPFAIPSDSMDATLETGDYIVVNKLAYGPRLPMTPLTIPFTHQTIGGMKSYLEWFSFPYMRLPGYSSVKRNDVLVFNFPAEDLFPLNGKPVNYPVDHRTHFVKRCVALPGDTLQIIDHEVYINGVLLPMPQKVQLNYTVKTDTANFKKLHLEKLGLMREGREGKYEMLTMTLTQRQADSLRLVKEIISVDADISRAGLYDEQLFPHSESFPWNLDNYGPVVIPKKGTTVKLTVDSLPIYERIIVNYEHNTMSVKNDSIFVNGKYTTSYTFRMNYFFMMGDNREYSMDSRYWGFVPEDHIVGRAVMILFSYDRKNGHVRWDRCFENIH